MSLVFISYRRSDSAPSATALRQSLVSALGENSVYLDVASNEPGINYPKKLREQLIKADVVLVVIGPNWLTTANEWGQRRIDFNDDWVHIEISTALNKHNTRVIPVLIDDTDMPPLTALPTAISTLPTRQAIRLRHDSWDITIKGLLDVLGEHTKEDSKVDSIVEVSLGTSIREEIRGVIRSELPLALHFQSIVEELTRIVPWESNGTLGTEKRDRATRLLQQISNRYLSKIDAALNAVFPHLFTILTESGRWQGFSLQYKEHANGDVDNHEGCILLLPDNRGLIIGATVTKQVILGYNSGIAPTSAKEPLLQVGKALGQVDAEQYF